MNIQNMAQIFIIYVELSPIIRSKFQKKEKVIFQSPKLRNSSAGIHSFHFKLFIQGKKHSVHTGKKLLYNVPC